MPEHTVNHRPADCPIAAGCGGCALISLDYREQLRAKTGRVRAALARHRELASIAVQPCVPAPSPLHYRNRAKLAVGRSPGGVTLGLYRRGTNRIEDLAPCLVHRPVVQRGMEVVREWLAEHGLASDRTSPTFSGQDAPVIYVDLREAAGERCHLTVVVAGPRDGRALPFDDLRARWPEVAGIALNYGNADSSYPLGTDTRIVLGADTFDAPVSDEAGRTLALAVPVTGFFQVSTGLLPEIHRRMRAHLGSEGGLLDLYCGIGLHGLLLERLGAGTHVVGVEENSAACDAARRNADALEVRARYLAGRVEDEIDALLRDGAPRRIIVNPGRSGCRPGVLDRLASIDARIAYLSCNPDTLARDLAATAGAGLRVESMIPFDLMPQTDQVEALALLTRA